jgi:hypothetical protein
VIEPLALLPQHERLHLEALLECRRHDAVDTARELARFAQGLGVPDADGVRVVGLERLGLEPHHPTRSEALVLQRLLVGTDVEIDHLGPEGAQHRVVVFEGGAVDEAHQEAVAAPGTGGRGAEGKRRRKGQSKSSEIHWLSVAAPGLHLTPEHQGGGPQRGARPWRSRERTVSA